jgi:transposase
MYSQLEQDVTSALNGLSTMIPQQLEPPQVPDKRQNRAAIQALGKLGLSNTRIASTFKINIKTVKRWKHRIGIDDAKRPREPTVLSNDTKDMIEALCRDKWGASTHKITKCLNTSTEFIQTGQTISRASVIKYLKSTDWGCVAYRPIIKPIISPKNVADRLAFCHMLHDAHYCDTGQEAIWLLEHVLFMDESVVELFPKPNSQNTQIRTSAPDHRGVVGIPKNGLKIMVAGGLCANGLSRLHVVEQGATINGEYYRMKILPVYIATLQVDGSNINGIRPIGSLFAEPSNVVFMQDGAPAHTARATMSFLAPHFSTLWSKGVWPGNSPDLNPIEHLWPILQDSVFVKPRPRTRAKLIQRVVETWDSILLVLIRKLVFSFPARVMACLSNNGSHTKY